jgi:heme-degrading monooxygenase HmoA
MAETTGGQILICRMWHGWTAAENALDYDLYLRDELFPRLERDLAHHGYRGFHVLRRKDGDEEEFVTMVWFQSLDSVRAFAGNDFETPVISAKAQSLLSRYANQVSHFELSGSSLPGWAGSPD